MNPDDIPTEITKLVYTAPWVGDPKFGAAKLSQNEAAQQIAHYWPAIEAHLRSQIADQVQERNPDTCVDFSAGVDWATAVIRGESDV